MSDDDAPGRETLAVAALLVVGVGLRLAFVLDYPTLAFSDFRALLDFGLEMRRGWAPETWHWIQFNPGLAMALSGVLAIFPDPGTAARHATAGLTGLLPLLPFFLWRPFMSLGWRFLAGLLLAVWPGQVFFSGVVAQENWALVPTVALAALAVRVLRAPATRARPLVAGLLLAAATAFRQELLIVLLPAALAAAGLFRRERGVARIRRGATLAVSAGVLLFALAGQRYAASRRFAVTTEHGGLALLGSVVPGASEAGWVDPRAYIASVDPDLLENRTLTRKAASRLAVDEWERRPGFHLLRAASVAGRLAVESDADDLFWSVGSPQALPAALRARGAELYARWFPRLRWELALIQGLFLATLLGALRRRENVLVVPRRDSVPRAVPRRNTGVLVLAACVLLKFGLQSVASPLGRLMVPATALEILAIALGLAALPTARSAVRFGLVTVAAAAALLLVAPRLSALAASKDEAPHPVARFPLEMGANATAFARCTVEEGDVASLEWKRAWLQPKPGGVARVTCRFPDTDGVAVRIDSVPGTDALRAEADLGGSTVSLVPGSATDLDLPPGSGRVATFTVSARSGISFPRRLKD